MLFRSLSVFIPTAFVSGITGELYKQFALTIAVSTAFSGLSALTLTPSLCALFLRRSNPAKTNNVVYRVFNKGYGATLNVYLKVVGSFLRRPWVAIAVYFIITGAAFYGFLKMPSSYIPQEDMGYFLGSVQLPTGASLERTDKVMNDVSARMLKIPEVKDVLTISGTSFMTGGAGSNLGAVIAVLKPWKERKGKDESVDAVIKRFEAACADIEEAIIFGLNPPAIPGVGLTSGLQMQILDINNKGASEMASAITAIKDAAEKDPRLASVTSLYESGVPQYRLDIDRDKVKMMGLRLEDINSTLSAYMGGNYVNDFTDFGRMYQVNIAANAEARANVDDIGALTVKNATGGMVPFSSFVKIVPTMGQSTVSRYNMYETAAITGTPAHGVSSSDGIKAMEEIIRKAVGDQYSYAWTGEAYQETQGGTTITFVLIFAVVVTLLVLAAQYESLTDPVAVIISMPTAILGTVVGCIFMGQSIDIYTQIGIILLLGLSAKNAILIVEYAIDYRKAGMDVRKAALSAGEVRFRPIMMTALAFVFGVMPMLFATGAGAASRISLGTAVVFGMFVNAVVGTLFVPNFWELLHRFGEKHLNNFFHGDPGNAVAPASTTDDKTDSNGV